ncbi:MAG: hypothetical protein ACREDY_06435, partial [Bradyrhizobium sp.]
MRIGKGRTHCYLTVAFPLNQAATVREIFQHRRVLVTLADAETAAAPDGIKAGNWRRDIPTLTDAVFR